MTITTEIDPIIFDIFKQVDSRLMVSYFDCSNTQAMLNYVYFYRKGF